MAGHLRGINGAAFSQNGKCLLTVSNDYTTRIWETDSWRFIGVLRGHTNYVLGAAFSPKGNFIATVSQDNSARFYDCEVCDEFDKLLERARDRAKSRRDRDQRSLGYL
jgi:WD40 repeat protein